MKKFSAPPMIIILDVLFVVLFILVLEESPNIQIILPKDKWLEDVLVTSIDENSECQHWYDRTSNEWKEWKSLIGRERKFEAVIGNINCQKYEYCKNIEEVPLSEKKKLYIKGNLYDELTWLVSDSCLKFPKECSNVTYHIKNDGTVDKQRLKEDHQIFRYILKGK